ncbi:hypothetical protein [Massilia sp. Se16.2.3]|uniref:hypothetical protein n=1 Tax=Massilia sp. Se16.2.3 TaxID=2709303 RepID=UPI001E3C2F3D|nr:hypothetical protein [Massilia sp. Se16.2.3]
MAWPEPESRALFDAARPLFEERGHALVYGDAATWFMRADGWGELDTATVDAAPGMDLTDWMPIGAQAAAFRRLQNEVQIEWHAHPVNAAREARRLPAVNGFWLWGGAEATRQRAPGLRLAALDTPPWLAALSDVRIDDPAALIAALSTGFATDTVLVCGSVAPYARAADWGGWVAQMQMLEAGLFAPILAALMKGRLRGVSLVLGHREALAEFTTNALAQRKFWRRPTLDRLL